jgi:hypothetical protein
MDDEERSSLEPPRKTPTVFGIAPFRGPIPAGRKTALVIIIGAIAGAIVAFIPLFIIVALISSS